MFNSRIATAARTAVVGACIGMASVFLASACRPATPSTPAANASPITTGIYGNPPVMPAATPSLTATSGVYGNPAAAAKYWQEQSLEDNCGLMSVADVVGEIIGHAPTEQQMIALAEDTPSGTNSGPIYAPRDDPSHEGGNGGIQMADEVVLLDHYGIKSVLTDAALPALEQYLSNGRKIIALVNAAIIRNNSDQRTKADHFLVVTGIDTNKEIVHLNDPGADHADSQVTLTAFTDAWRTGQESIVVTTG